MKKTKEQNVSTVNGKAPVVVVQDADGYQNPLDRSEMIVVLRQRLTSLKGKKVRTAEEFFTEFFAKHKFSHKD